jgi:hypothetical protein
VGLVPVQADAAVGANPLQHKLLVSPKQAKAILSGATSRAGGLFLLLCGMSPLGHAQYAVALAILEARLGDLPVNAVHKDFRLCLGVVSVLDAGLYRQNAHTHAHNPRP